MAWCEANRVDYVFGLAKNERLVAEIARELEAAEEGSQKDGCARPPLQGVHVETSDSWSRKRRVIGKPSGPRAKPIPASSSRRSNGPRLQRNHSTKIFIASAATWKTASKNAKAICSLTARRQRPCAPISCGRRLSSTATS